MIIRNWCIVGEPMVTSYTAPECIGACLRGEIYGHMRFDDGETITTSCVKEVSEDGRHITTYSGSKYFLDGPNKDYKKWVKKMYPNLKWDGESLIIDTSRKKGN